MTSVPDSESLSYTNPDPPAKKLWRTALLLLKCVENQNLNSGRKSRSFNKDAPFVIPSAAEGPAVFQSFG